MQRFKCKRWQFPLLLVGVCFLAGGVDAFAQLQAGRIVGQVYDSQHAVIPRATVKVTNSGTILQFRFEAFNVPNSAYFAAPSNTNIGSSAGGQITSTGNNPRQLQFALKYVF
jgi:hypothetical protein